MGFEHLRPRTPSSCQLGFNANYLFWLGYADTFMGPEEIVDWINSVSSYLQDWYDHVLSKPKNKLHLQKIRCNVDAFVKDMHEATQEQHALARQDGKLVYCPSQNLLSAKSSGALGFRHDTAATVCLIAHYGIRGGPFANRDDEGAWHLAANMLLVAIIIDLEDGDHSAPQFKKNGQVMADARQSALADGAVATLAQQLHERTMQSDNGFRPEDELVEAMRLGLSSISLSK
ncbi:hypothetical protein MBLNU13_g11090t1 [Cladosporium sp. NU13]